MFTAASLNSVLVLQLLFTLSISMDNTTLSEGGKTDLTAPFLNNDSMPGGWSSMCISAVNTINNKTNISISCHVTDKDNWDFNDFRNWSASLGSNTLLFLDVRCDVNGTICLPWPYRAANLDTLKFQGCINICYMTDYYRQNIVESIPDTLRVVEGYNITTKSTLMQLLSIDVKNLSASLECGPLKMETFIYRKIKSIVTSPKGKLPLKDENITDSLTQNVRAQNDVQHICRYVNIRVYDVSQRIDSSTSFLYSTLVNSRFPQLRTLNLSQTELQVFPSILSVWRHRFEMLETLDLSYNNISRFDLRDMSLTSQDVGVIDLSHNNIKTIGAPEIKSFKLVNKAIIDVRGNPFECNCAMANFSHYLQTHKNPEDAELLESYSYLWDLQCISPSEFTGKRIADLTRDMLCSTDLTSYIAQITVLSIVVVLLLVVIVLMARYRREIRILAFTRLHIVLPCEPVEVPCKKVYDAFVAYSHHDTTWVVKTLLPRLENGEGVGGNFRLCLHQRDFEVGAAIADNIVQSVEASRHTILVLSKDFLKSEWCLMEFRTAFHQSLIEKKKHLILVLLEDISPGDLDPDLRRCMQTWTYLHVADRLFWDRIVYSLTDKSKSRFKMFRRHKHANTEEGQKEKKAATNEAMTLEDEGDKRFEQEIDDFPYEFNEEKRV